MKKKHYFVKKTEFPSVIGKNRPKTDEEAQIRCIGCLYYNCSQKSCQSPAFDESIYVTIALRHQCYLRGLALFKKSYEDGMTFDKGKILVK